MGIDCTYLMILGFGYGTRIRDVMKVENERKKMVRKRT